RGCGRRREALDVLARDEVRSARRDHDHDWHAVSEVVMWRVVLVLALLVAARVAHADGPPKGILTKAPQLVTFVPADYPPDEKAAGRTASVLLQVDIAIDGTVTAAAVTGSAGPAFDAAATAAVKQFRFSPAEIDGVPAAVRIEYQYDFTVEVTVE